MPIISPNKDYISYMNDFYIKNNGIKVLIFKLDKKRTQIDDLYMEERGGRIYLPPFELNAMYFDPKFQGVLGLNLFSQELVAGSGNQLFYFNFDTMVKKHFELKNGLVKTKLIITYSGSEKFEIEADGQSFSVYKIDEQIAKVEYNSFRTIEKLVNNLNTISGVTASFEGENCPSKFIGIFSKVNITKRIAEVEIKDDIYKNITDVVQSGDIIITEKNDAFEAVEGNLEGNFGWKYATYKVTCKSADIRQASLPGFSANSYTRNRSGVASYIEMEK